jgi:integrase/recombinase XerD
MKTKKLENLIKQVLDELEFRNYGVSYLTTAIVEWERLKIWCNQDQKDHFCEEIGYLYLDSYLGFHLIPNYKISQTTRRILRQIRMLTSYLMTGDFEFRSAKVEFQFHGDIGKWVNQFIDFCRNEKGLSEASIDERKRCLMRFSKFICDEEIQADVINTAQFEKFFSSLKLSQSSRNGYRYKLKDFLSYAYSQGYLKRNLSGLILKGNKAPVPQKVFTTYTEEEIKKILASTERGSAIGKRNYVVLLLAAQYGLRSGDITRLKLSQIDWQNNRIEIDQQKTGDRLVLPLLASVGNAIIDYWKNGRPSCCKDNTIVVSHTMITMGGKLHSSTIHSIVCDGLARAAIPNWKEKKHGAHSLRHSLATNLLKKNVSLPIISTVLGHRSTESTKVYVGVDIKRLRQCSLPIPILNSPFYRNTMENVYE